MSIAPVARLAAAAALALFSTLASAAFPERPVRVVVPFAPGGGTDLVGRTIASASTLEVDLRATEGDKTAKARKVGELVAARAKAAGVEAVVFDRGGNKYHGRVAAVADGAREGGLAL